MIHGQKKHQITSVVKIIKIYRFIQSGYIYKMARTSLWFHWDGFCSDS